MDDADVVRGGEADENLAHQRRELVRLDAPAIFDATR